MVIMMVSSLFFSLPLENPYVFRQFYMRRTKKIQKNSQPFFLTHLRVRLCSKAFWGGGLFASIQTEGALRRAIPIQPAYVPVAKTFRFDSVSRHHDERQRTDSAGPGLSRCRSRVIGTYSTVVSYVCSRTRLQMQMSLLSVIQV